MKRLRSTDDLENYGEKGVSKDWGRREEDPGLHRTSSHRNFYYKPEGARKGLSSSSSRYDRLEDDRETLRPVRKRPDYDIDTYDRRKSYDRYRDFNDRGILSPSPRAGYVPDRMYKSESFSGPRREFPKGFRSDRDRPRREGSDSSWRRFGSGKDDNEGTKSGGSDSARVSRTDLDDVGKAKSPQGSRDAKSPTRSKDSSSEQSKSVEAKKTKDLPVDKVGHSEMEEGELEPDQHPLPITGSTENERSTTALNPPQKELSVECHAEHEHSDDKEIPPGESVELSKSHARRTNSDKEPSETPKDVVSEAHELLDSPTTSNLVRNDITDETGISVGNSRSEDKEHHMKNNKFIDELKNVQTEHADQLRKEQMKDKDKDEDTEAMADSSNLPEPDMVLDNEDTEHAVVSSFLPKDNTRTCIDKGKTVVSACNGGSFTEEDSLKIASESRGLVTYKEVDAEGPSTTGFEFFSINPIKKSEDVDEQRDSKTKDGKLEMEPLELSLSLPNVLLPINSCDTAQAPSSPNHGRDSQSIHRTRSVQSFPSSLRANSDGYTVSMSFSGSQNFSHNPSCSLNHNSLDFEQSVKSRPLFQGVDWQALQSNEPKNNEGTVYQGIPSNQHGLHQNSQIFQGNSSGQASARHLKVTEGTIIPAGLQRHLSFNKYLSDGQTLYSNGVKSPPHSVESYENGAEYTKGKKLVNRDKDGSLYRISNTDGKEKQFDVGVDFAESVITMIVSEPLHVTGRRFSEMHAQSIASVKEFVRDIITKPAKQWQLSALQKALENKQDISLDMLLKSHRTQLEILVALRTGLQEFLQLNHDVSPSDLAEIFLNMRCRNTACRNSLPVDECDCKLCTQKSGFCRDCMCLVCSKFDNASNTCSWVGCDVCLHWCHADCALRKSYISNGHSSSGVQGSVEMQFHCVACNHPSEMFGFVKEVFLNFLKEWTAENLCRELEYVKKIFSASEDVRGRRLHDVATQMLSKLANKTSLQEIRNHIMGFFTEAESIKSDNIPISSGKNFTTKNQEANEGVAGCSRDEMWLKSVGAGKSFQPQKSADIIPRFDGNHIDKHSMRSDVRTSAQKEPVFDELETIVRMKHEEAKMSQRRAEEARREAEALKRIAVSKNEKLEEEYLSRITKLRLSEAEEMCKQKAEELHVLERAYQEYSTMKMRMESEIKDLLLRMEATRRNLRM